MKINTSGRVALITGANRGIGLQTAKDLGPDRVFLLLGVRNLAKGQAVAERMCNEGFEVETVHLNVTDPSTHGKFMILSTVFLGASISGKTWSRSAVY